ncbi:protein LAZ1 [Tanacetum coccineum]
MCSTNKIFQNFLELIWIRRIGHPGYGVSDLLGTAYCLLRYDVLGSLGTAYWLIGYGVLAHSIWRIGSLGTVFYTSWVRRIELLGYGVLTQSVLFLIFDQSIIYDVYTDVDTAYSLKLGNGLLIRQSLGYILTNRIIGGIKEIVSENQSTFVPGRHISDKILITQELMHNYHLDRGPPRCAFKVDIQKAYDTVDWRFIGHILKCFGFHPVMIQWIMACITSTSFSISINGDIHGFFKGKHDLRQGDPLFSYLFTLVLEILTLILQRGDVASAVVIMESLNEFQHVLGELPVKYLGVPLISSRLLNKDCKILVEKARNHIEDWKNKSLSLAGRLQLFKSVISAMQCTQSLLSHHLSPRDIARAGYNLRTCVSDLVAHGGWNWPSTWLAKAPILVSIPSSVLDYTSQDCMKLRDTNGNFSEFSVRCAWEALRPSGNEVSWFHLVWFSHCIPRHAFHLWLVMRRCLKTQDLLKPWDVGPDTISLFGGTVKGVVGKLIFAAASYYVWLERNNRLFKSIRRQPEELCDLIIVTVCLKLLTFKFNNTVKVESLLSLWKMPKGFRIYG